MFLIKLIRFKSRKLILIHEKRVHLSFSSSVAEKLSYFKGDDFIIIFLLINRLIYKSKNFFKCTEQAPDTKSKHIFLGSGSRTNKKHVKIKRGTCELPS